jgi:predicted RND superfamily exporter protein
MKKIILFVSILCLMLTFFSVSVFAEGEEIVTDETVTEEPAVDETETGETETSANVFTRIYEFWLAHEAEIITAASSVVLIVLNVLTGKSSKVLNVAQNDTIGGVNRLIEAYDDIKDGFGGVTKAFAELKDDSEKLFKELSSAINTITETVTKLMETDAELAAKLNNSNKVITDLVEMEMLQNNALMDVLSSVYVNANGIPQGVRDLVTLKRAENIRIANEAHEIAHPHTAEEVKSDA